MRIVAGEWRGRKLVAPKGDITRPTADRMRETLFSMLTSRLGSFDELTVADLFCGLRRRWGLEALSTRRCGGGPACLLNRIAPHLMRSARISPRLASGYAPGSKPGRQHNCAPRPSRSTSSSADPPYHSSVGEVALDRLLRLGWVGPETCDRAGDGRARGGQHKRPCARIRTAGSAKAGSASCGWLRPRPTRVRLLAEQR